MGNVGTPPSGKHVARISQWHVARVISRTIIIRIPLRIRMMQFSYPDSFKERQMTFQLLLSKEEQTTLAEHRYSDNLHNAYVPSGYNHSDHQLKKNKSYTLSQQAAMTHIPITCRVRRQDEVTESHFPLSFYMITSHDLWQPHHLPWFLTAVRRVMMLLLTTIIIITA